MTMGERIQELRKKGGLSQESLGEQLSVSRQAISKWESDTAIPEVDKLIAMSRLFAVPVGVLLGVEESDGANGEPTGQELTERELAAVETIVSRYVQESEKHRPKLKRWPFAVLAAVVVIAFWSMYERLDNVSSQYTYLNNNIYSIQASVASQIGSLTGQVTDILDQQNSIVADYTCVTEKIEPPETVTLQVSATPKEYTEGMTAEFWTESSDAASVTEQGTWQGTAFAATLVVPMSDEIRVYVGFYTDGVKTTQLLETLSGYKTGWMLEVYGRTATSSTPSRVSDALHMNSKVWFQISGAYVGENQPVTAEVLLQQNALLPR